jgi:two-component sensor histidine kinase
MHDMGGDMNFLAVKPRVGVTCSLVILALACALALATAKECHQNIANHNLAAPFAPSLLFGCVTWFWWATITIALWRFAERRSTVLRFSPRAALVHLGIACVVASSHMALLQHTIWFASAHWPAWGRLYASMSVEGPERFGVDVVMYGFIYGVSGFLYSQFQTQQTLIQKLEVERQLSQAQLKALQMQMEPHFLFNTLNALASLVAQGRNREASKTLVHLNTILRTTLQRRAPEKVPFAEELRVIESYLAIQKVRFAHRLEVKIETTQEALDGLIPCFLLQPLVENAIQHGISPMEAGGLIETSVKRVGDKLWMQVRDNGCGPNGLQTKGHGIGMQNIRERLAYFYPDAYQFDAVAPLGGGYEVTIQIPYERTTA